ncbi:MAG: hypothetical protein JJ911_19155 [Rhizobiaceae bacterium]|nr:hypothetical protein [Rhizobiaceae bacterium]
MQLLEPGEVYAAMIAAAKTAYMFIDSSKFDATSLAQYGEWCPKMTLITDKLPGAHIQAALSAASVDILLP